MKHVVTQLLVFVAIALFCWLIVYLISLPPLVLSDMTF